MDDPGNGFAQAGRPMAVVAADSALDALRSNHQRALFSLSRQESFELLDAYERVQRALDHARLQLVRHLDVNRHGDPHGTAAVMIDRTLAHPAVASLQVALSEVLVGPLAATGEDLAAGVISCHHARVIYRVMDMLRKSTPADVRRRVEEQLLVWAADLDPQALRVAGMSLVATIQNTADNDDLFRTQRRNRSLRFSELEDGMTGVHGRLDPDSAATVTAAIDALAAPDPAVDGVRDPRTHSQRQADALTAICDKAMNDGDAPTQGGAVPHVTVIVPWDTIAHEPDECHGQGCGAPGHGGPSTASSEGAGGLGPEESEPDESEPDGFRPEEFGPAGPGPNPDGEMDLECLFGDDGSGQPPALTESGPFALPRQVVDRITCDSAIRRLLLGPHAVSINVGRATRVIPPGLRAAIIARDKICTFPGCRKPAKWCRVHHVIHWNNHGETSLENCVLVCHQHHMYVHENGWMVRIIARGRVEWRPPEHWGDRPWRTNHLRTPYDALATSLRR
jgi:hypothetical protein